MFPTKWRTQDVPWPLRPAWRLPGSKRTRRLVRRQPLRYACLSLCIFSLLQGLCFLGFFHFYFVFLCRLLFPAVFLCICVATWRILRSTFPASRIVYSLILQTWYTILLLTLLVQQLGRTNDCCASLCWVFYAFPYTTQHTGMSQMSLATVLATNTALDLPLNTISQTRVHRHTNLWEEAGWLLSWGAYWIV